MKTKIRAYFIADAYRYHILTTDLQTYNAAMFDYLNLLSISQKSNSYSFGTVEMTKEEFDRYFKETNLARMNKVENKEKPRVEKFRIVE